MVINSVNNISFKAIWRVRQSQFTESQMNVVKDIQTKLGKKAEKNDFIVEPLENDIIELSQVSS